jgi:rare lipoprotein A
MKSLLILLRLGLLCCIFFFSGNAFSQTTEKESKHAKKSSKKTGRTLYGQASYYSNSFNGRKTSTGEKFDQKKFTAACNALPLGTWIQVTNLRNGKIAVVKTNDRLHPKTKRLVDLTRAAAQKLGFISAGLTRVKVVVLDQTLYK